MSKETFHVEQTPDSIEGIRNEESQLLERAEGNPAAERAAKRFVSATGIMEARR